MITLKEKFEEKKLKIQSKSRKSVKTRVHLSMNSQHIESFKTQEDTQVLKNRSSASYSSDLKNYKQKIKELNEEKSSLNEAIKSNEKECLFLNQIISQFVDFSEIMRIKKKSNYDDETQSWDVPYFVVQGNQVLFPKIQASDIACSNVKRRKIVFKAIESKASDAFSTEDSSFKKEKYSEKEERPGTLISKYRKTSMGRRGNGMREEGKSPVPREAKFNL